MSPNHPGNGLGWSQRALVVFALSGWVVAALLGVLFWFHLSLGRDPGNDAPSTTSKLAEREPPLAVVEESPPPPVAATTTAGSEVSEPRPVEATHDASAVIAAHLRHAAVFTDAGDYDKAIASYDEAIALEPDNADFRMLRSQVEEMRVLASGQSVATSLALRESSTVYIPASGEPGPALPRVAEGVEVRRATRAAEFPGELVVSLRPRAVAPGDPYVVSIRLYNKGNRVIDVQAVTVSFLHGERAEDVASRAAPRIARVSPRDTALLWERQGTWQESQRSGGIEVTVHLPDGAELTKQVSW